MYTSAQKLSHLAKYVFDKVKFMYIYSELGLLQDEMYLFNNNNKNNNNNA